MLQMPQSLTSHNLAHSRHFSSIYPIYDALRRSKNLRERKRRRRRELSRRSRELWRRSTTILSTDHKVSSSQISHPVAAWLATLPENHALPRNHQSLEDGHSLGLSRVSRGCLTKKKATEDLSKYFSSLFEFAKPQ